MNSLPSTPAARHRPEAARHRPEAARHRPEAAARSTGSLYCGLAAFGGCDVAPEWSRHTAALVPDAECHAAPSASVPVAAIPVAREHTFRALCTSRRTPSAALLAISA